MALHFSAAVAGRILNEFLGHASPLTASADPIRAPSAARALPTVAPTWVSAERVLPKAQNILFG